MLGWILTRSSGCDCWIGDRSGIGAGGRDGKRSCVCGFHQPSLIWLISGPEVTCGICNLPGTLSRASIGTPHDVRADYAASSAVWGWTTTGTFNSVVPYLVLATGPGNPPAVRVLTAKTGRFGSRPVQKPDPLTLGGPNPVPYPSTRGFRRVWLDLSVPISGSAFRVSHLWSHSDMLLLIVK